MSVLLQSYLISCGRWQIGKGGNEKEIVNGFYHRWLLLLVQVSCIRYIGDCRPLAVYAHHQVDQFHNTNEISSVLCINSEH